MLYQLYDFGQWTLAPLRFVAAMVKNAAAPLQFSVMGRSLAAGAELVERTTRHYNKPEWGLHETEQHGKKIALNLEKIIEKPFCTLLHFARTITKQPGKDGQKDAAKDSTRALPKLLVVAPLSGHHATLLRGTIEAMLPEHDVYITDWQDASTVPLAAGAFDLETNITYIMEFIRHLGSDVHVMAVCQPAVPVLCAVALLAQLKEACQPRSMILMGGPIDARVNPTKVTRLAEKHPLAWFERMAISPVPLGHAGVNRRVYPGFLQLSSFMSMHLDRHVSEHMNLFRTLVKGDGESAARSRAFYDEYLAVMDITAEFYLQTVERVFQNHALAKGTFAWQDQIVNPAAIEKTALLTIEGELDDISAPGQTYAAQALCKGLAEDKKHHYFAKQVGHYGIFNGKRWRKEIQPIIRDFIRKHNHG